MRIAQLSDLHLHGAVGQDSSYLQFLQCLALARTYSPDYLLLTGDLVNDGNSLGYDWLLERLEDCLVPYFCLSGNHDVTFEKYPHLPYHKRQHFAIAKDSRLIDYDIYPLKTHQLICLNTSLAGQASGQISKTCLDWLRKTLSQQTNPTLIAMHHPPIKVGSAWIDALGLVNADEFLAVVACFEHVHAIICGHVHQAHTVYYKHIPIYTSPATSRQFLPFSDVFCLDSKKAGIRLFDIKDQQINSQVLRLT